MREKMSDAKIEKEEFSKFLPEVLFSTEQRFHHIKFMNGTERVGFIAFREFREYYEIMNVEISDEYKNKGYAKFMYKSALEYAKENGLVGLLSGKNTLCPIQIDAVRKHFYNYTYYRSSNPASRRIALTDWLG